VTPEFLKSRNRYVKFGHLLTLAEKQVIWNYCVMDYGNGYDQPYKPYEAMEAIHSSLSRFKLLSLPNRGGKSLAVSAEIVAKICNPKGGVRIWIVAEEYAIADNEFLYLEDMIFKTKLYDEYLIPEIQRQMEKKGLTGKASKRIKFRRSPTKSITIDWPDGNRTIVEQKSYKNASQWTRLEGSKLAMLVFAEGATVPKDLWDRHIKKRLADLGGEVWIPSTPKGEDETFFPWFHLGLSEKMVVSIDWDSEKVSHRMEAVELSKHHVTKANGYLQSYESFQWAGSESPYYNHEQYLEDEKALFAGTLSEAIFRESNYGEFTSKTGRFFGDKCDIAVIDSRHFKMHPDSTYFRTIDIGGSAPSACLWVAIEPPAADGSERMVVFRELYKGNLWVGSKGQDGFEDTLAGRILNMTHEPIEWTTADRVSAVRTSPNSQKNIQEMLYDSGIPLFLPPHMDKEKITWFSKLKHMLITGRIVILEDKCPNLCKELRMAEYGDAIYKKGRKIVKDVLADNADHAITALIFLTYTNPFWVKPHNQIEKEISDAKPASTSFLSALQDIEISENNFLHSKVGTF